MRFLCCGDTHISKQKPIGRLDDNYWNTVKEKLDFVFNSYHQYECDYFLHSGDLIDSYFVPEEIKIYLIEQLYNIKPSLIMTLGQHCLQNRNLTDNCSVKLLWKNNSLDILSTRVNESYRVLDYNTDIYGCGFEEEIPNVKNEDKLNILLIHTMVSDKDYWNGYIKWKSPKWFFRNTKFDIVISGDNHGSIVANKGNRWVLNSGSMMRKNVLQEDHRPCFFIVDVEDKIEVEQIFIPVKPFSDIMNVSKHEKKKEKEFNDASWKAELNRKDWSLNVNFKENLIKEAEELNDEEIKKIVNECLEE